MPTPTPTPTGDWSSTSNRYFVVGAYAPGFGLKNLTVTLTATGQFSYDEVKALMDSRPVVIVRLDTLASLLDGVLADDPQAIRDASAWLTTNQPE